MTAGLCNGRFSDEVVEILRRDPENACLSQPCAKCGKHVVAKNKGGTWVPESHEMPILYKSGKSGYKR
jgi:hypothetical protein